MTNSEDLRKQLRKLNESSQYLQRETEMLTRRLLAARSTLETIAKRDSRPEGLRIASEALASLEALNTIIEAPEAFASYEEALKAQIPPVDVAELKRFRELIESLSEELGPPAGGSSAKGSIATHGLQSLVEKACGPGSNARVLSHRNGVLEMLLREGYLAPLQTGMELPEAMLQLFATIPFTHANHNPEVFVERLRLEGYGNQNKPSLASLDEETRYRRLLHHYREMGVGNQQLQYEHSVAERKMAIARTALETLANGETKPEVSKLARETLDGFNVLSEPEQFMKFMMGVQQSQPISEVDPIELKRFHERLVEQAGHLKPGTAIGFGVMAPGMSPTEVGPLWLRNAFLGLLANQGLLAEWQRGTELDDVAFRVAATIPVNGVQFDPEAFVTRLRAEEALSRREAS